MCMFLIRLRGWLVGRGFGHESVQGLERWGGKVGRELVQGSVQRGGGRQEMV